MSGEKAEKSKEKVARVVPFDTESLYKLIAKGQVRIDINGELMQLELLDVEEMREEDADNIENAHTALGALLDDLGDLLGDEDSDFDDDDDESDLDDSDTEEPLEEEPEP